MIDKKASIHDEIQGIMQEDFPVDDIDLDTKRWVSKDLALQKRQGELRARKIGALKAQSVVDAFNVRLAQVAPDDNVCVGDLKIFAIRPVSHNGVELFLTKHGTEPEFRIFNPPMLIQDPIGTVESYGKKYREDPLAAVAFAVKSIGGKR